MDEVLKDGLGAVEGRFYGTTALIDANTSSLQDITAWRGGVDSQVSDLTASMEAMRKQVDRVVVKVGHSALGTPPSVAASLKPPASHTASAALQEQGSGLPGHD